MSSPAPGARRSWPPRLSIRFRISIILLLATLNSVGLAATCLVLLSILQEGASSEEIAAARNLAAAAGGVNDHVVVDVPTPEGIAAVEGTLQRMADELGAFGPEAGAAREELELYRGAVARFYDHHHGLGAGALADSEDPHGKAHLAELRLANRRLVGAIQMLMVSERPAWVDAARGWMVPALLWVVLCAVATLVFARGLQRLLSVPLGRLAGVAQAVARGDLDQEVPVPPGDTEVALLAQAMASMRDRLVGLIRDLDRRNEETATILGNMSDGVLLADTDGRVLEANAEADALLRFLAGDTLVAEGSSLPARVPEIAVAQLRGAETEVQVNRGHMGARRRFVEVRIRPVLGPSAQRVVMLRDITAERELEQMKSDFMSVVTHELKTPLTAIDGYARLLARGKAGELNERARGFVDTIQAQAGVLKDMVQNLLDTSRLEAGNLPIHPEPNDLGELLRTTAGTWRGSVEARGLTFVLDVDDVVGTRISVDPFRLQQVLGNLFSNALKFTPSGRIALGARREGGEACLWVEDSGRGIPPEAAERIFEKFYQVERGDTRVAGGAGLGLYISRALVEAQGGRIAVASSLGDGSRFEIRFPLSEAHGA